ncbi:MAG: hypothetical protein HY902_14545 [Deltaproteobacteria bacterium]|nr:hypothetical protein [Deltaproteobacteria bacterium]
MNHLHLRIAAVAALSLAGLAQTGCKGCDKAPEAPAIKPAGTEKAPVPAGLPAAASAVDAPAPVSPEVYPGPRSESLDGWRITSGFANAKDEAQTQPSAVEDTKVYVTVLDDKSRPVGRLAKLERAELHLFVVARDLRHARYAFGNGPVKEGADARAATIHMPGGGDHAMIAVFKPEGGAARVVSAPVTVKGVLPEVMGPGLGSLGPRAKSEAEHVALLSTPSQIIAGKPVVLAAQDLDAQDKPKGDLNLPFVVIVNDQMGWGDVVEWDAQGKGTWTPRQPGDYLVLAPPTRGTTALTFRLHVDAPPKQ